MSDLNSKATVDLQLNGQSAKQELEDLKQRAFHLKNAMAKVADAEGKINSQDYKKLKREFDQTNRKINQIRASAEMVDDVMRRLDKASPNELKQSLRSVEQSMKKLARDSPLWEKQAKKARLLRAEIDKMNSSLRVGKSRWERFNMAMNNMQTTIMAVVAAIVGLVQASRGAVNAYAEMDAEMANVRKYTGMTAQQVEGLNEEFKKMDTRTSREELNKLAQEAGRLGKTSQEDILGFVRASDQINVALDELGDGATLTLSKLTNIFGDEKRLGTERSLLAVGSVINDLSQNSTASASYLADFAKRLAGVGNQAHMTIQEIMAFGAVLDSQGQAVEMSATALSKLIMELFKKTDVIAQATGMDLNKFKEALASSTNEGLLMLLDRLHELGGMDVLAPVFKDMGENGARASSVIAALAGNVDVLRQQQEAANSAFEQATSVTKEYTVQNTTVQAELDKRKKAFTELAVSLGKELLPLMKYAISTTTALMEVLKYVVGFVKEHWKTIISLTAGVVGYYSAVKLSILWDKKDVIIKTTKAVLLGTLKAGYHLLGAAVNLCTGNVKTATQAWKAFSAALKANPIGLIVGAVFALGAALVIWAKSSNKALEAQKALNKVNSDAQAKAAEQLSSLNLLIAAAKNENLALSERKRAIDRLNSIIPGYNASLDATTGKYKENKSALDEYIKSLEHQYAVEGARDTIKALHKERAEIIASLSTEGKGTIENLKTKGFYGLIWEDLKNKITDKNLSLKELRDKVYRGQAIDSQLAALYSAYGEDMQQAEIKNPTAITNEVGNGDIPQTPTTTQTQSRFSAQQENRKRKEAQNRIAYATGSIVYQEYKYRMLQIEKEYYDEISQLTDLSEKELLEIKLGYAENAKNLEKIDSEISIERVQQGYKAKLAETQQAFIDGKLSTEAYNEQIERIESDHLQNMVDFTLEGTEERKKAEKALADFELKNAMDKKKKLEAIEKDIKKQFFGENASDNKTNYDLAMTALDSVYQAELKATEGNEAEKLRITEAYEQAKLALKQKYNAEAIADDRNQFEKFNDSVMQWLESDVGKAVVGSFDTITSGLSSIFSQVSGLVQAELEIQSNAIEKRYEKEIKMAEGNKYKIAQLEKKKEKEIAKAKNEANRKMFAMQVIQAVAQTAQNALAAYGSAAHIPLIGYILAPIAASMALAAGALQVAVIKKQQKASQSQGYASGGYTRKGRKYEPAGVVHAGEWVASQELLANPVARPIIDSLDYAQRNNRIASLRSEDVSASITAPSVIAGNTNGNIASAMTAQAVALSSYADSINRLNQRLNEPFVTVNTVTGDMGIRKAQDDYQKLIRNKQPKQ